jgi:hypothetical protein
MEEGAARIFTFDGITSRFDAEVLITRKWVDYMRE